MIWFVIWTLIAVGVFLWNHLNGNPYLGVRGTQQLFGHPLSGGWLASGVAVYCLIRSFVRLVRRKRRAGQGADPGA